MNAGPPRIPRPVPRQLRVVALAVLLLAMYVLMRIGVAGVTRSLSGS